MRRVLLLSASILLACSPPEPSELVRIPAPAPRTLDDIVGRALERGMPGAVVAVVRDGGLAVLEAYGVASLETGEAMRPDHVFQVGALAPAVLGMTFAALDAEGTLPLDAPLGDRMGRLPGRLAEATASQLLSHTSGLANAAVRGPLPADSLPLAPRWLTRLDIVAPPGVFFSRSEQGLRLAGRLAEVAGGAAYPDVVRRAVFQPLELEHTTFDPERARELGLAAGYDRKRNPVRGEPAGPPFPVPPYPDSATLRPTALLYSSAPDLARLALALMAVDDTATADDEAAFARVLKPRAGPPPNPGPYADIVVGLATEVTRRKGIPTVEFISYRGGHGAVFRLLPTVGLAVIVLCNTEGPFIAPADFIVDRILGMEDVFEVGHRPEPPAGPWWPLDRMTGTYRNGTETVELVPSGESLVLRTGAIEMPVHHTGGNWYNATVPDGRRGMEFAMFRQPDGATYLYYRLKAYRKVTDTQRRQ